MATYVRQSSFSDGDTITAALFNNEFNQLVNAFHVETGHTHDGATTGDGGPISNLFSNALVFGTNANTDVAITFNATTNDGVLTWMEDEDYFQFSDDLLIATTEKIQFRDTGLYINSSADGQLDIVADTEIQIAATTIDINGNADISGNLGIGGNLTVTGTTTFNGGTITMGDAATDNVVFGADVNSNIIPNTDSAFDLGSSTQEWRDLYLDGTAHIDTLDVDVNATIAGTLGVTGVLTGTSLDISGDIDVDGTTNLDVVDIDGAVDMATTLAVAGNVDFNGDLDVDGTTNLDVVDIDGAVNMATTLLVTGNVDFNGDLDVDGTTNLDVVDIDGAVDMATTLAVAGVLTAASLDISGNVDIDGTLETDALSLNGTTVTATAADINLIDGITNGTVIASKAIVTDANIDITGGRNITISGELDAATLDISGNADIDGTLEADAITVNGTALASVIAGTTVANATTAAVATTVTITDNENTNENNAIIFTAGGDLDGGNLGLESDGDLKYNPSTGTLSATNISVSGTLSTVDSVTMSANNAVVFEGATADAHETTLTVVDATADRTITLPNVSGTVPVLAAASNTQITSTPEEINALDGITAVVGELNALDIGSTAVGTAVASKAVILDSNKDYTGVRNLTISGELDAATLDVSGNVDVDGVLETDNLTIGGAQGTDGQVLTSTGSGVGWEDAAAGFNPDAAVVFNESSADVDFRVESDNLTHALFVQGSDGNIGVGDSSPSYPLEIANANSTSIAYQRTGVSAKKWGFTSDNDTTIWSNITDSVSAMTLTNAGAATFAGAITANAGVVVDNITIDGTEIDLSSGDLTVDVAGNIILDADGGDIKFLDGGTETLRYSGSGAGPQFFSPVADKDIIFKGKDGSSTITALTLDMSNAGAATFNSDLVIPNAILHAGDTGNYMQFHQADGWRIVNSGGERFHIQGDKVVFNHDGHDQDFRVESNDNANMLFVDGGNNRVGMGTAAPATELHIKATSGEAELRLEAVAGSEARLRFGDANDNDAGYVGYSKANGNLNFSALNTDGEHMRINADGKVGINNTTPTKGQLVVSGAVATNETCLLSFDDFGTRGTGTAQRIDFRMGRTGQVTDNPASIVCITEGDGASTASHFNSLEFRTVGANTINNNHFKLNAGGAKIQFMTDEVPQSNNPITSVCFVIGPSASGAVTQGLTDACVLQNRSGELFAIDSSHNNTQITPHNWGLISAGASEELAWTYYSQRPNPSDNDQLQTINVDMAKVIRKVEDLVGEKLIYTENSNKDSHSFKNIIADIQTTLTNLTTRITNLEG